MNLVEEDKKRTEFSQVLKDLAMAQNPSQYDKAQFFNRLEALYHTPGEEKDFRHFYSDILTVLIEIKENDPKSGSLEYLILNLDGLRQGYIPNKNLDSTGVPIDIQDYIRKLYDHVNLEIRRLNYSDSEYIIFSRAEDIKQLEKQISDAKKSAQKSQDEIDEKLANTQKEYVAILGIFASIVLAFTGGLVFSSSVLENMHIVNAYRLLIITLTIGLILFNVIYLLVWYINKIIRSESKEGFRIWRNVHIVIGILMAAVILSWVFGAVEHRNERIFQSDIERSVVETESPDNSSYIKNLDEIPSP